MAKGKGFGSREDAITDAVARALIEARHTDGACRIVVCDGGESCEANASADYACPLCEIITCHPNGTVERVSPNKH